MAGVHAMARKESASGELVSVFSRNKEKARDLGEKSNASWTTDWDIFISDPRVELVSVCTPSGTHLDYGRKAAEAGRHVIVEKPIEVTMERAETLIRICEDCGVRLSVIFQNRFIPGVVEMKGLVDRGGPGK